MCGEKTFNRYILPVKPISLGAQTATELKVIDGVLHHKDKPVGTVSTAEALVSFIDFLSHFSRKPILMGHNIKRFDIPVLLHHLKMNKMKGAFSEVIEGFADTLAIARAMLPKQSSYKQENLVKNHLQKEYEAHNALADVKALEELARTKLLCDVKQFMFPLDTVVLNQSLLPLVKAKIISTLIKTKLVNTGLGLQHLQLAHSRDSSAGIKLLLSEKGSNKKSRVTNNSAIIAKLQGYFDSIKTS